jgi:hypothetical protein
LVWVAAGSDFVGFVGFVGFLNGFEGVAGVFIAWGAMFFAVFLLAFGRLLLGERGCEIEAYSPLSWSGTTNRSGNMPQSRGLLAVLKIYARNGHYFKAAQSAAIGTSLANPGL